jgi:uncharacterized membrane protein
MKYLEKILAILIPIFIFLKFMLVPISSVLLAISLILLALIYYPLGFAFFNNIRLRNIFKKESYKDVTALHIIGAIAIGMALSDICVGILFKIQGYPLANTFLIVGLITTFIILIIGLIRYLKSKSNYYLYMFKRIGIISVLGIVFLIVSDLALVKLQFRNHPGYVKAYQEYKANPRTEESEAKLKLEYMRATMSDEDFQKYQEYLKTDSVKY